MIQKFTSFFYFHAIKWIFLLNSISFKQFFPSICCKSNFINNYEIQKVFYVPALLIFIIFSKGLGVLRRVLRAWRYWVASRFRFLFCVGAKKSRFWTPFRLNRISRYHLYIPNTKPHFFAKKNNLVIIEKNLKKQRKNTTMKSWRIPKEKLVKMLLFSAVFLVVKERLYEFVFG